MSKELGELRVEYTAYAEANSSRSDLVTFEGLCEILDKIVALKNAMIKADCRVPPRKPGARTDRNRRPKP